MITKNKLLDLIAEQSFEMSELRTRIVDLEQGLRTVQNMQKEFICSNPSRLEKAIADVAEPKRGRGRPKKA